MGEQPQEIAQYAIYAHPSDYPEGFILREWLANSDGTVRPGQGFAAATIEDARALLPKDAVQIGGRDPNDPVIIEVWVGTRDGSR